MTTTATIQATDRDWLKRYYALRALVSAVWVALAFTVGASDPLLATVLIIAYPAWDCLANYLDARQSGGLSANPTQFANAAVSAVVTVAVAIAATHGIHAVIGVIGAWATLSGILQLATAVRRWRSASAQWPMILSGGQSALAGTFFIKQAVDPASLLSVTAVASYAAIGAIYFGISAVVLAFSSRR